jgi:benzoate membrane transport protein
VLALSIPCAVMTLPSDSLRSAGLAQPIFAGVLAAVVGFASAFAVVLQGLTAVGATPAQAASGLLALCVVKGPLAIWLSWRSKLPISIAWSTPGAALLIATGIPVGGFPAAVGAFLVAGGLIVAAGLWRPFGRAVESIPAHLAGAMLAGVLLDLCLAPVKAVAAMPALALPIVVAWVLTWRFARLWAVPVAVAVTVAVVVLAVPLAPGALADIAPTPILIAPVFTVGAVVGIAVPLFIVTMASQNVPGLAVLQVNGYRPAPAPLFISTGLATALTAPFGGHALNLAAITAALCSGPEAHPDPGKRWVATVAAGTAYVALGLGAGFAAALIAAAPPLLIQAVAGLALLGSLAAALAGSLSREEDRLPAIVTFVTSASGLSIFGIGAAFWGLIAGGLILALSRMGK